MHEPQSEMTRDAADDEKEAIIARLLAKAELEFKCSGGHCSGRMCDAGADND
jgi:hypothetical protein